VVSFEPRLLERDERSLLDLVLSVDFPGAEALRVQAQSVVAVGRCDCGCPTIDLQVADGVPAAEGLTGGLVPAEGRVRPVAEEPPGDIIVFVDGGKLSCLEYVYYDGPPSAWLSLDRIEVIF
jgi:hypothetical protein